MLMQDALIMANFTVAEQIAVSPRSMLCLLPLVAALVVIYKVTKLPTIKPLNFIKETATLFGSIIVFMVITALVLLALTWLVTE